MTARVAALGGVVAALVLAAMIILLLSAPAKTEPEPVSCTAATRCELPDQDISTDNLDYPRG